MNIINTLWNVRNFFVRMCIEYEDNKSEFNLEDCEKIYVKRKVEKG